ncbi:hypothetical protein ACIRVF_39075 [Kitasatospora sp. NPDC101157]|uniref:hypothetical protein n=1 Tax=Kitasatospora sp. NPDC101157 TaxID=3364098 RepID=UPI00380CCFC5
MTTALPPALRQFDGHPNAALAARVWRDLTRIGIPVHLMTDERGQGPDGMSLAVNDDSLTLVWNRPTGDTTSPAFDDVFTEASHAAHVLTAAIAGILVTFGYQVKGKLEFGEEAFPPYIHVKSGS